VKHAETRGLNELLAYWTHVNAILLSLWWFLVCERRILISCPALQVSKTDGSIS